MNRAAVFAAMLATATPVAAQEAAVCSGSAFDLAQRFVGAWQEFAVTAEGEQLAGRLDTTLEAGGCAIAQAFAGASASKAPTPIAWSRKRRRPMPRRGPPASSP